MYNMDRYDLMIDMIKKKTHQSHGSEIIINKKNHH